MGNSNDVRGGVLILPGGKESDATASRTWHLANQRMIWLEWALRRRLGRAVAVRRVRYAMRGWNSPDRPALRDAQAALSAMQQDLDAKPVVLVGHSMGGRVAAHLAEHNPVSGVVALAPWWPRAEASLVPTTCRLLTIHGTADRWTDPRSSEAQTRAARERGVDARWIGMPGAGHFLLRDVGEWHRLTAEFVAAELLPTT